MKMFSQTTAVLLVGIVASFALAAIPTGTIGVRTLDVNLQPLPDIDIRVTHVAGQWEIEPIDATTDIGALVWISVPAGTYSVSVVGASGLVIPESTVQVFVAGGANDLIVPVVVTTLCATDVDDSGEVDVNDLTAVIIGWGPCDEGGDCAADADGSGAVDVLDLVATILEWGDC